MPEPVDIEAQNKSNAWDMITSAFKMKRVYKKRGVSELSARGRKRKMRKKPKGYLYIFDKEKD